MDPFLGIPAVGIPEGFQFFDVWFDLFGSQNLAARAWAGLGLGQVWGWAEKPSFDYMTLSIAANRFILRLKPRASRSFLTHSIRQSIINGAGSAAEATEIMGQNPGTSRNSLELKGASPKV